MPSVQLQHAPAQTPKLDTCEVITDGSSAIGFGGLSLSLSLLLFVPSLLVGCGWVGHGVRVRAAELTSHRVSLSIVVTACSCCHEHVVEVVGVV